MTDGRSVARARSGHRKQRTVRRASGGLTPTRAAAALIVLLVLGALYGSVATTAFEVQSVQVEGTAIGREDVIRERLGLSVDQAPPNVLFLRTDDLRRRLEEIATVEDATVSVALPGTVRVSIIEREPILVWASGPNRYLADRSGRLFADAADPDATEATRAAALRLRVVEDGRGTAALFKIGDRIDPFLFDAATRLASVVPAQVGSAAQGLRVTIDDLDGFVLAAEPDGWQAVFGFYAAQLRAPTMIPGQVRLLRSLLADREASVARVVLADETNGTFTSR